MEGHNCLKTITFENDVEMTDLGPEGLNAKESKPGTSAGTPLNPSARKELKGLRRVKLELLDLKHGGSVDNSLSFIESTKNVRVGAAMTVPDTDSTNNVVVGVALTGPDAGTENKMDIPGGNAGLEQNRKGISIKLLKQRNKEKQRMNYKSTRKKTQLRRSG